MFGKRKQELLAKMGLDPATLQQAAGRIQAATTAQGRTQVAYRLLVQRVAAGAEMPATLRSFVIGEAQPQMGGVSVSLQLVIEPSGGTAYAATADQVLPEAITHTLAEGQRLTVKVAPDDPQCVMLWNTPHASGGADPDTGRPMDATGTGAPTDDRIARLEKLGELRDAGVLTEEEFQAQKAKILARRVGT
jgi:putative oligomerization/nucleic acid binding protein